MLTMVRTVKFAVGRNKGCSREKNETKYFREEEPKDFISFLLNIWNLYYTVFSKIGKH